MEKLKEIYLITPEQFKRVPDGSILIDIFGDEVVKGQDEIDQDTRFGYIAFGFPKDKFPNGIELFENRRWIIHPNTLRS